MEKCLKESELQEFGSVLDCASLHLLPYLLDLGSTMSIRLVTNLIKGKWSFRHGLHYCWEP